MNQDSSNTNNMARLPMNTLEEIPTPGADAQAITGLVKKGGRITGYQLADGRVLTKEEGVALARQGGIRGVGVARRGDTEYLKSLPDDAEGNNLGNLPSVTQ